MKPWTFVTNHALVLLAIAENPGQTTRLIAAQVGITERAVQRILDDLENGGYITRTRVGRRNEYTVHTDQPMRHPTQQNNSIYQLIRLLGTVSAPATETDGAAS